MEWGIGSSDRITSNRESRGGEPFGYPQPPEAGSRRASAAQRRQRRNDRSLSDRWERVPRQTSALGTVRRASFPGKGTGAQSENWRKEFQKISPTKIQDRNQEPERSPGSPNQGREGGISLTDRGGRVALRLRPRSGRGRFIGEPRANARFTPRGRIFREL